MEVAENKEVTVATRQCHNNKETEVISQGGGAQVVIEEAAPIPIDTSLIKNETEADMVFGSYDEVTNCITIFMPPAEEEQQQQQEMVVVVKEEQSQQDHQQEFSEEEIKSIAAPLAPCLSPLSSLSLMESGYQSMGSPSGYSDDLWSSGGGDVAPVERMDELWNDSFSELFPSLV